MSETPILTVEHELKCWPEFYSAIENGSKTFELRKDDRGFKAGDVLRLREWRRLRIVDGQSEGEYTGRELYRVVSYVLSGWGLEPGYVCLAIRQPEDSHEALRAQLAEAERQRDELLDLLRQVLAQACFSDNEQQYNSWALSGYADGLNCLARYGRVRIIREYGRSVVAVDADQAQTSSAAVARAEPTTTAAYAAGRADVLRRVREQIEAFPRRIEPIGGQQTSYVQLDNVLAVLEQTEAHAAETKEEP